MISASCVTVLVAACREWACFSWSALLVKGGKDRSHMNEQGCRKDDTGGEEEHFPRWALQWIEDERTRWRSSHMGGNRDVLRYQARTCWNAERMARELNVAVEQILLWQRTRGPVNCPLPRVLEVPEEIGPLWLASWAQLWIGRWRQEQAAAAKVGIVRARQKRPRNSRPQVVAGKDLMAPGEVADLTQLPLRLVREWAERGSPCPPLDISQEKAPGHGYWYRSTIGPWLCGWFAAQAAKREKRVATQAAPVCLSPMHSARGGTGKATVDLYERIKQDFAGLGEDTVPTDLARLADAYPRMLAHAGHLGELPVWLVDAADCLISAGFWHAFNIGTSDMPSGGPAAVFAQGLRGVWHIRSNMLATAYAEFSEAMRFPLLPAPARDLLRLQRGRALCLMANWRTAFYEYQILAREKGPYACQARCSLAEFYRAAGRFREAVDIMPGADEMRGIGLNRAAVLSTVFRENALFTEGVALACAGMREAEVWGSEGGVAEIESNLAWSLCWVRPKEAIVCARHVLEVSSRLGNEIDVQRAYVALAIAQVGNAPVETVQSSLLAAEDLARSKGDRTGELLAVWGCLWFAAVKEDKEEFVRKFAQLEDLSFAVSAYQYFLDIARAWAWSPGYSKEGKRHAARWQWLDSAEDALRRWRCVLDRRKALARAGGVLEQG